MDKGVAITGMGVVSAIGSNTAMNYEALVSGESGIDFPKNLLTKHKDLPVGEVALTNKDIAEKLKLSRGHLYTRAALLGAMAIKEAIEQSQLNIDSQTGFISGTSVGGMDATEKYFTEFAAGKLNNKEFIRAQHPGFTSQKIADYFGITGYVSTISTACSSSANAIMLGARLIKAGKLKRVIVGGTDCLTRFTLNGFNALKILSKEVCKPFDENRIGLNLGEAAAYLILEAEDEIKDKKVFGRLKGYGNSNDAFHQTASSKDGEGAFLAMQKALSTAIISGDAIDYINAHGTATKNNDAAESIALQRIFNNNMPKFSSTKAFTGHTLAAAGSLEAVYSLLSITKNQIFPNLNFSQPMQDSHLIPVTKLEEQKIHTVLSNSFGFGGNCTSLIFSHDE